jgi:hypothetical protein
MIARLEHGIARTGVLFLDRAMKLLEIKNCSELGSFDKWIVTITRTKRLQK